jgi:hypothetical protein
VHSCAEWPAVLNHFMDWVVMDWDHYTDKPNMFFKELYQLPF